MNFRYKGGYAIQQCVIIRTLIKSNFDYEIRLRNGTQVYVWKDEIIGFNSYLKLL